VGSVSSEATTRPPGGRDGGSTATAAASSPVTPGAAPRSHGVDPESERAWLAGLQRGEAAAFDGVYGAYRPRVFGYLARMTGRRDLAEDLLQETFLRLARRARDLRDDTRLGAWLFTVAHNLVVSQARAARVTTALAAELALRPATLAATPFEALAENRTQLAVERAVAALAPPYREVLLLVAVEGMSPAEAAEVMGIRPDAARQRLARARASVEQSLEPGLRPTTRSA
jgi:RNA polymerase sigma-70 factor (ECF subfamily)